MEKKEMTRSQVYAVRAANAKLEFAKMEFQTIIDTIAEELKVDAKNEKWMLSKDMKSLERQMIVLEKNQKKEK